MDNKIITPEKINRLWSLFREQYLTPVEFSELAGGYDKSGIYKKFANNTLPYEEIGGVKKIYMTSIEAQILLHECLLRSLDEIKSVDYDQDGKPTKNKMYLEYFALVETCSRLIHSLRLDMKPQEREAEGITRYEILNMRFMDVIENINSGLIDAADIFEIMELDNYEIETVKEVLSGKRDFEYIRGVK